MAPLPFEEAHFALALALLGALVAPPLLLGLTRLLVRDRDGFAYAAGGVASASLAFAAVLAKPAVGPTLVQRSGGWNVAFMLLVAGLTFAGFFVRLKSVRGQRPERPRPGALVLGFVIGFGPLVGVWAARRVLDVAPDEVRSVSSAAAWWAVRVDPWDGEAVLALAWEARGEELLELAEARLALAERLGAPLGGRLELAAELAATRGDCERARELFDEALREQASETFASGGRLELGGYALPETLVRECGLGAPEGEW